MAVLRAESIKDASVFLEGYWGGARLVPFFFFFILYFFWRGFGSVARACAGCELTWVCVEGLLGWGEGGGEEGGMNAKWQGLISFAEVPP